MNTVFSLLVGAVGGFVLGLIYHTAVLTELAKVVGEIKADVAKLVSKL